jgi:hypothetical protein
MRSSSPAPVGLGAPALTALSTWLREKQQADRERARRDFEDLRALLDKLTPAMFDHTNLLLRLEEWMQDRATRRQRVDSPPDLEASRRQLYMLNARLVIRRGREDALVKSLGVYLKISDESRDEIGQLWEDDLSFDYSDKQLAERAGRYWSAYEAFTDDCKSVVGSASPHAPSPS